MSILVATWGGANLLAVRSDTAEVIRQDGPDVAEVIARLSEPARSWLPGDAVRYSRPGDPDHVEHVLTIIPGSTVVGPD